MLPGGMSSYGRIQRSGLDAESIPMTDQGKRPSNSSECRSASIEGQGDRDGRAGYGHADYASSMAEFGSPLLLPRCRGWLLRRRIGDSEWHDAMGLYPLFFCDDWDQLGPDLVDLAGDLVSVVLVTDPFAAISDRALGETFDHVARFKEHYVVDLRQDPQDFVRASHRARARKALRSVEVHVADRPAEFLGEWLMLFETLCQRHGITGIRAFSSEAFRRQLTIEGLVLFVASAQDEIVGLDLWYVDRKVAYGHLAAFSELGYQLGASYATKWRILEYFRDRVDWIDLMGTPGRSDASGGGLAAFKSGWSTGTRPTYLCGRILNAERYHELARRTSDVSSGYFPAYRDGELA